MLPAYNEMILPLLQFAADGKTHTTHEAIPIIAKIFGLSDADLGQTLRRSKMLTVVNRLAWARVWLGKGNLIEKVGKSGFRITEKGTNLLAKKPTVLGIDEIQKLVPKGLEPPAKPLTPLEQIENAHSQLDQELRETLRVGLGSLSPTAFEHLVVELVKRMGYGDGTQDSGSVTDPGPDGGIDGVIKEDPLGFEKVYVQAKRWKGSVGSPVVSGFIGSLEAHHARHGLMITTSSFTSDAKRMVKKTGKSVVLIDGDSLAALMIQYGVGVYEKASFKVHEINLTPFTDL